MIEDKILKNAVVGTGIGAISGGGIGAAIANLMGRNPWLGALIGSIPGAAVGAYADYNSGEGRSRENIDPKLDTAGRRDFEGRVALQSLVNPNEEGGLTLGDIWGEPTSDPNRERRFSSFQPSSGFVTSADNTEWKRRQEKIDARNSRPIGTLYDAEVLSRPMLENLVASLDDRTIEALEDAGIDPEDYIDAFVSQRIALGQGGRNPGLGQTENAFRRLMEEKVREHQAEQRRIAEQRQAEEELHRQMMNETFGLNHGGSPELQRQLQEALKAD